VRGRRQRHRLPQQLTLRQQVLACVIPSVCPSAPSCSCHVYCCIQATAEPPPHCLQSRPALSHAPADKGGIACLAETAVADQAEVVRKLKEGQGLNNKDEPVVAAVEELLKRKQHVAALQEALEQLVVQ